MISNYRSMLFGWCCFQNTLNPLSQLFLFPIYVKWEKIYFNKLKHKYSLVWKLNLKDINQIYNCKLI